MQRRPPLPLPPSVQGRSRWESAGLGKPTVSLTKRSSSVKLSDSVPEPDDVNQRRSSVNEGLLRQMQINEKPKPHTTTTTRVPRLRPTPAGIAARSASPRLPPLTTVTVPLCSHSCGTHGNEMWDDVVQQAKLSDVLGCSTASTRSLAVDEITGQAAYIAGSTVVIVKGRQTHLISTSRNSLTALAFSQCGRYLATGEGGHEPMVRVWHVCDDDGNFIGREMHQLKGHAFEVSLVSFSTGGNTYLVSVGNQHDKEMFLWDWRQGTQLANGRVMSIVHSISMSSDGATFITAGVKHVKVWHYSRETEKLHGRSAILGDKRNCAFSSGVYADEHRYFAIADSAFVVEMIDKKIVNTYRFGKKLYALAILGSYLLIGLEGGTVSACNLDDGLSTAWSFPLPHHIGMDPAEATHSSALNPTNHPGDAVYPDVCCIAVHPSSCIVSVQYSDRSIYQWKYRGNHVVEKVYSDLSHVGGITALEMYPAHLPFLPSGTFVTGGVDGTVRFWNTAKDVEEQIIQTSLLPPTNVYSKTLKKILFYSIDPKVLTEEKESTKIVATARLDNSNAVKSLRFSPDGRHLAIGFANGELRIVDVVEMTILHSVDAHDSDIFTVEYNDQARGGPPLLATGSRDRIVHVFSANKNYDHCATFLDHQSGVIGIKFAQTHDAFKMFTMGTDKLILIWHYNKDSSSLFTRVNTISPNVPLSDMLLWPGPNDVMSLMVASGDKQFRIFSLSGKPQQCIAATGPGSGTPGKVCIDPSGTVSATIFDRMVHIMDLRAHKLIAVLPGFGQTPSHAAFSTNLKSLVVASANGCIYVWRLSSRVTTRLITASKALAERLERVPTPDSVIGSGSDCISEELPDKAFDSLSGGGSSFGSVESINVDPPLGTTFVVTIDESRGVAVERRAEEVVRRSTSNLHATTSNYDLTAEENPAPIAQEERSPRQYTSSKSMSNLRIPLADQRDPSVPRRPRTKWGLDQPAQDLDFSGNSSILLAGLLDNRGGVPGQEENIYQAPMMAPPNGINGAYAGTSLSMQRQVDLGPPRYTSSPLARNAPMARSSPFNRSDSGRVSLSKSFLNREGLSQIQKEEKTNPQTVWSPQQLSSSRRTISNMQFSSSPSASPQQNAPSGAVASAITRRQSAALARNGIPKTSPSSAEKTPMDKVRRSRTFGRLRDLTEGPSPPSSGRTTTSTASGRRSTIADDYSSSALHLRSRSQSPNQLIQNGHLSTPKSRRDSDMSFSGSPLSLSSRFTTSRTNLNQSEGIRKSNQALDKLTQMRSKLRQSTENIMAPLDGDDSSEYQQSPTSTVSRSKSIGNLRNGINGTSNGGNVPLEPYGTFDADRGTSRLSSSSLSHSRMLARSMGNVSVSGEEGSPNGRGRSGSGAPSAKLAHTIQMLKKASNPDLTQGDLYDENTSFQERLTNRRGAVQKRVERYHPRNRTTVRTGTSEESDSNTSDASPMNGSLTGGRRYFGAAANRSASSVEGRTGLGQRRMFDGVRHGSTVVNNNLTPPRRNYLAQKMEGDGEGGPDLGSDESARSSNNSQEFVAKFDRMPTQDKNMARHVDQALEDFSTYLDKVLCASRLVFESDISPESRDLLAERMMKSLKQSDAKITKEMEKFGGRRNTEDSLQNDVYRTTSATVAPSTNPTVDMNEFFSQHGQQVMDFLKKNLSKDN